MNRHCDAEVLNLKFNPDNIFELTKSGYRLANAFQCIIVSMIENVTNMSILTILVLFTKRDILML